MTVIPASFIKHSGKIWVKNVEYLSLTQLKSVQKSDRFCTEFRTLVFESCHLPEIDDYTNCLVLVTNDLFTLPWLTRIFQILHCCSAIISFSIAHRPNLIMKIYRKGLKAKNLCKPSSCNELSHNITHIPQCSGCVYSPR